jgi:hypothetical protein
MSTAPRPSPRAKEIPIREASRPDVRNHMETLLRVPVVVPAAHHWCSLRWHRRRDPSTFVPLQDKAFLRVRKKPPYHPRGGRIILQTPKDRVAPVPTG